jgi:hypothetical protein
LIAHALEEKLKEKAMQKYIESQPDFEGTPHEQEIKQQSED